jgi:uncharacterized Zn finger protein
MARRGGGRGFDSGWQQFADSKPIAVEGGIASSKARGAMASTWWSKRFTDVLESYGLGGRMTRGRSYARKGQVLSLEISAGLMVAQVQGSRALPYAVTIRIKPPSDTQWHKLEDLLRLRAGYAASMLAGEVPTDLEAVFADAQCSLFPVEWRDLRATCSCPDWGDPCKHQAAVLYVFADQLDSDPWQLLALHGRTRDDILALFAVGGGAGVVGQDGDGAVEIAPWWPLAPGTQRGDEVHVQLRPIPVADPAAVLGRMAPSGVSTSDGTPIESVVGELLN